ncbi:MAG: hypothetical protein Q9202_007644 [Teloschistes flavicans]
MQQVYQATTFTYLPRQDGSNHGNIGSWRLSLSSDGTNWRLYNGTWSDNQLLKVIDLTVPEGNPWPTRFWKLDAYSEAGSRGPWSSAAEFNVFDSSSGTTGNPAAASNTPNAHGTTTNTSPTSSQNPTTSTSPAPATASSASTSATAGGGGLSKDTQSQNKIALGVGLGIGIPTLLVTILGLFLNRNRLRAVF